MIKLQSMPIKSTAISQPSRSDIIEGKSSKLVKTIGDDTV